MSGILAADVIRFVPVIFVVSPKLGEEVALKLTPGEGAESATVMARNIAVDPMLYDAIGLLNDMRLTNLLARADDWRYMTPDEIDACIQRNGQDLEYGINRYAYEPLAADEAQAD